MTINLKPNTSLKHFFQQKNRFSDLMNDTCFNGRQVLSHELLVSEDSDVSTVFVNADIPWSINASRDLIMYTAQHGIYILIAIENQSTVDYTMPLRSFLYDAYSYKKQHQNYLNEKKLNNYAKLKLLPIYTVVLY